VWGASCPHIPRSYFNRCLSRPPYSFSPYDFPVSIFNVIFTFAVNAAAIQSSRTPSFYAVISEARRDVCRLDTHRSRRLARYNRDSTSTTHLPSVTPSCERATTAWCKIWTLHTSLQASQDAFRPYSCRSDTIATVASDPCSYHGSVCCG
jgi:hypothetical protein